MARPHCDTPLVDDWQIFIWWVCCEYHCELLASLWQKKKEKSHKIKNPKLQTSSPLDEEENQLRDTVVNWNQITKEFLI